MNADPTIARLPHFETIHQSIAERYAEGHCPAQIFAALTGEGLDTEPAVAALQHVLGAALTPREVDALLRGSPGPDLEGAPSAIDVMGREVRVVMNLRKPRVMLFDRLLDDAECYEIMRIARPRLQRSTQNYDGSKAITENVDDARTSESANLLRHERIAVCDLLDARVQALLNWPIDFAGGWQVLRYGVGGQFKPHYDCFHDNLGPWHPAMRRGGHRCATLIVYLQSPTRGGSTVLPELSLEVPAQRGSALFFAYPKPVRVLHGGSPVLEGEKWAMVKWFRQGPFDRA
jgi:prolyl 4-hydroxylase